MPFSMPRLQISPSPPFTQEVITYPQPSNSPISHASRIILILRYQIRRWETSCAQTQLSLEGTKRDAVKVEGGAPIPPCHPLCHPLRRRPRHMDVVLCVRLRLNPFFHVNWLLAMLFMG